MKLLLPFVIALGAMLPLLAAAQSADTLQQHYRVFTGNGEASSLEAIGAAMDGASVVFIGEAHDDPVAHGLELAILQEAFERKGDRVALSLEMFERDVQLIVDEYLQGTITEQHFLAAARPWPNYATDYRPMVEFARAHRLDVIAANAPRRYVNMVSRSGPDSLKLLSRPARSYLAPLPYAGATDAYRRKWNRLMGGMEGGHGTSMPSASHMLDAQSLWDATMAHSIATYLKRHRDALVVHAVGGFHVESGSGIPDHLKRYNRRARAVIVSIQPETAWQSFDSGKHANLGDFVILTNVALPRTRR